MYVLGKLKKGLVVLVATERIRLPCGTLCCDVLAYLGQLAELGDIWLGGYA